MHTGQGIFAEIGPVAGEKIKKRSFYTDDEIRTYYRRAENKKRQIRILSELNCCSMKEIKEILGIQEN